MEAHISIAGAKELDRMLTALPRTVGKKVTRRAVRAGAKVIAAKAKQNARSIVGGTMGSLIAKALAPRAAKRQKRGEYHINVLIKSREEFYHTTVAGTTHYIPAAIEYGHRGAAAIPWYRKAFETEKDKALRAVIDETRRGVDEAAKT
jgi:HK97 gp10 family phage protein